MGAADYARLPAVGVRHLANAVRTGGRRGVGLGTFAQCFVVQTAQGVGQDAGNLHLGDVQRPCDLRLRAGLEEPHDQYAAFPARHFAMSGRTAIAFSVSS